MIYDIQKASLLRRFSAFLLDIILIVVLAAGFAFLLSWITHMSDYNKTLKNFYKEYEEKYRAGYEEQYNKKFDFNINQTDYEKLSQEEKSYYDMAYKAIFSSETNPEWQKAAKAKNMVSSLPLLIVSISLLLSFLVFELVFPLCFKNGQTVGKKVFALGVVFKNSVRVTPMALVARGVLGKYTVEAMVPVLILMMEFYYNIMGIVGLIIVGLLLVLQIVLICVTKNNSCIHDILSNTVVVDLHTQMVFDTVDDLTAYIEQQHAEAAQKAEY